jgi:hypothetical protein
MGSKAVSPMSQLCGMKKNPAIYVKVGIAGQIYRPFLAQFRPSLTEVPRVAGRGAPLEIRGGTTGGAQRARTLKPKVRRGDSPVTATPIYHLSTICYLIPGVIPGLHLRLYEGKSENKVPILLPLNNLT